MRLAASGALVLLAAALTGCSGGGTSPVTSAGSASAATSTAKPGTGPGLELKDPRVTGMGKAGSFGQDNAKKAVVLAGQLSTAGWVSADSGAPAVKDRYAHYSTASANAAFNRTVNASGKGMAGYGAVAADAQPWGGQDTTVSNYAVEVLGTGKDKATGAATLRLRSSWDLSLTAPKGDANFKPGRYVTHYVDVIDVVIDPATGQAKASSFLNDSDDKISVVSAPQ